MANEAVDVSQVFKDIIEDFRKTKAAFDSAKVRIGIIGESGCGKSSLINAIAGEYISEIGVTETTSEPQDYAAEGGRVTYTDLPGSGTAKRPIASYVEDLKLATDYDAFILVNRGRILENDIAIYQKIHALNAPIFVVRNFFDAAVNGEKGKPEGQRREESALREVIEEDFRRQFKDPTLRVFCTATTPDAPPFDIDALRDAIIAELGLISASKAERFIADTKAASRELLDAKRALAKRWVHGAAAASAFGAVVPTPGAGLIVDIGAAVEMNRQVLKIFNLDIAPEAGSTSTPLQHSLQELAKYSSRESVVKWMAQTVAKKQAAKEVAKWVPIVGTAIAVAIAVGVTESLGHQVINKCYDASLKLISEELSA